MPKIILTFFLLLFELGALLAQSSLSLPVNENHTTIDSTRRIGKNSLSLHLTQLFVQEYRIGYERRIAKKHSLGIKLAYKVKTGSIDISYISDREPYLEVNSYTALFSYKYYFLGRTANYGIEPYAEVKSFIRYYEYEDVFFWSYSEKMGDVSTLESGYHFVYYGGINLGIRLFLSKKVPVYFDVYAGGGVREKNENVQIKAECQSYYGDCNSKTLANSSDNSQPFDKQIEVMPSISLGMKLGVLF